MPILLNSLKFHFFSFTNSRLFFNSLQNNAFLNDSFIESPSEKSKNDGENNPNLINRSTTDKIFNTATLPVIKEKGESSAEITGKRDSTSRQLNFDGIESDVVNKKEPDRPKISLFSKIQTSETTKKAIDPVSQRISDTAWKSKSVDVKTVNTVDGLIAPLEALAVKRAGSAPSEVKLCTELQTPKPKSSQNDGVGSVAKSNPEVEDETPYKTFQLPPTANMRRVQTSSQHRTLLTSASQPRKCRSELENEFRSQKVLFRTPSAVSRPALKVMSHLGLDDSLNCYQSSPVANLSPVKEERKENKPHSAESMPETIRTNENDGKTDVAAKPIASSTANETEKKVVTINGKDFVIQSKIGQGGSSSVFLVEHKETKLPCALKVASCHFICYESSFFLTNIHSLQVVDLRGDPALIEGYIKEVKILAMLQDKVNVIRLYE